jgi:hypothetical protein
MPSKSHPQNCFWLLLLLAVVCVLSLNIRVDWWRSERKSHFKLWKSILIPRDFFLLLLSVGGAGDDDGDKITMNHHSFRMPSLFSQFPFLFIVIISLYLCGAHTAFSLSFWIQKCVYTMTYTHTRIHETSWYSAEICWNEQDNCRGLPLMNVLQVSHHAIIHAMPWEKSRRLRWLRLLWWWRRRWIDGWN